MCHWFKWADIQLTSSVHLRLKLQTYISCIYFCWLILLGWTFFPRFTSCNNCQFLLAVIYEQQHLLSPINTATCCWSFPFKKTRLNPQVHFPAMETCWKLHRCFPKIENKGKLMSRFPLVFSRFSLLGNTFFPPSGCRKHTNKQKHTLSKLNNKRDLIWCQRFLGVIN